MSASLVGKNKVIHVWETASGKEWRSLQATKKENEMIRSVSFAPDGKSLAASTVIDNDVLDDRAPAWIRLWDLKTGKLIKSIDASWAGAIVFSPDGKWLADPWKGRFLNLDSGKKYRPQDAPERNDPYFSCSRSWSCRSRAANVYEPSAPSRSWRR